MATSPSPNSSPSADPPVSTTAPPPQPLSFPPALPTSQPNASSPTATPQAPPSQSPPSTNSTAPPPVPLSSPPPQPPIASPPPAAFPPPPPPIDVPPPSSNSPPPSPNLPASPPIPMPQVSPPKPTPPVSPPTPTPPASPPKSISLSPTPPVSPPTRIPTPPASPPTPPSEPPKNSAPPPPEPTENIPSPPSLPPEKPPSQPPPPPSSKPPKISPPPSESKPPQNSPPPPEAEPPKISPPPPPTPNITPPPPTSPPSSNSPPNLSPPLPRNLPSPPPHSLVPPSSPSPPSPSQVPIPPSDDLPTNKSNTPSNSNSTDNGGIGTGGTVAIVLVLGLVLLSLIGTIVWCVRKRNRKLAGFNGGHIIPTSLSSSPKSDSALLKVQTSGAWRGTGSGLVNSPTEPGGLGNSRSWFTYEELMDATNEFSAQNLLGEGGFGSVYKGYLADGREIAVKQLKIGGGQGEREFKAEVEIISRVHHRHLVSLVGYCISENQRLLVYDYVPNNNLYFHLHGEGRPVMAWETRVKVAVGAARGISYLHEDCHPRIIHRDIKSSNILLDNSFEARVSDFGLAKLALDANTHITTRVMGTFGYMAPEYAASGKLTEKSDVYSFGVVLLELITGRKPVDASQPLGDESLVEWARPLLSHALETEDFKALADPRLESNYVDGEMFRLIEAAAACVRHSAAKRPQMGQVVRAFDNLTNSDLTNGMRVGESEIINSAQQSAEIILFQRMAFGSQNYSTDFFSQSSGEQLRSI